MKLLNKIILATLISVISCLSLAQDREDDRLSRRYVQEPPILVSDEIRSSRSGDVVGEVKVYQIGDGLSLTMKVPDGYLTTEEELRIDSYSISELYYFLTNRTPVALIDAELELERQKKALDGVELLQAKPLNDLSFCDADPVNYPSWPEPKPPCDKAPSPQPNPNPGGPGDRKPVDPPDPDPKPLPEPEPIGKLIKKCYGGQNYWYLLFGFFFQLNVSCVNTDYSLILKDWTDISSLRVNNVQGYYDDDGQSVDVIIRHKDGGQWHGIQEKVKPGDWFYESFDFPYQIKMEYYAYPEDEYIDAENEDNTYYDFKIYAEKFGWDPFWFWY